MCHRRVEKKDLCCAMERKINRRSAIRVDLASRYFNRVM